MIEHWTTDLKKKKNERFDFGTLSRQMTNCRFQRETDKSGFHEIYSYYGNYDLRSEDINCSGATETYLPYYYFQYEKLCCTVMYAISNVQHGRVTLTFSNVPLKLNSDPYLNFGKSMNTVLTVMLDTKAENTFESPRNLFSRAFNPSILSGKTTTIA